MPRRRRTAGAAARRSTGRTAGDGTRRHASRFAALTSARRWCTTRHVDHDRAVSARPCTAQGSTLLHAYQLHTSNRTFSHQDPHKDSNTDQQTHPQTVPLESRPHKTWDRYQLAGRSKNLRGSQGHPCQRWLTGNGTIAPQRVVRRIVTEPHWVPGDSTPKRRLPPTTIVYNTHPHDHKSAL